MKPDQADFLRFVRNGLAMALALAILKGSRRAIAALSLLAPRAREEGIIASSDVSEIVLLALLGNAYRTTTQDRRAEVLRDALLASAIGTLAQMQAKQDAAFLAGLERIKAAAKSSADLKNSVEAWAQKFGAQGLADAPLAESYLESVAVLPGEAIGEHRALTAPGVAAMTPYLEFYDQEDPKVRPNHHLLHGFIARQDWPGWEKWCLPPLGWNCRCRVQAIPWYVARSRGLVGDFPGDSLDKLHRFREAGGADAGFPRELFVLGAAA